MTLHSHLKLYPLNHSGSLNFDSSISSATLSAKLFGDISSISRLSEFASFSFHSFHRNTCHDVIIPGSSISKGAITTSCCGIVANGPSGPCHTVKETIFAQFSNKTLAIFVGKCLLAFHATPIFASFRCFRRGFLFIIYYNYYVL